jgi:hypothetical protein
MLENINMGNNQDFEKSPTAIQSQNQGFWRMPDCN